MSYIMPAEFVTKMVDAGESKIHMSTRDTLIRAYMAGAILALAAVFAITITVQTGSALIGAVLFPVGFCMLYLMGFDLLTGVFVLAPLALIDKRPGVTVNGVLRNWGLVFVGNFAGALSVAFMMAFVFHLRFFNRTGCGRAKNCQYWRFPDLGLCRIRCCRVVHDFPTRHVMQLDGVHGCCGRNDLDVGER